MKQLSPCQKAILILAALFFKVDFTDIKPLVLIAKANSGYFNPLSAGLFLSSGNKMPIFIFKKKSLMNVSKQKKYR